MKCPSCQHENSPLAKYCGRCRMAFKTFSLAVAKAKDHLYWILRRASAGSFAGFIAWFFIPVITRIMSQTGSGGYFVYGLTGFVGGAFLGSVDGMVDESTPKTIRGAVIGGIGGLLGGLIFQFFMYRVSPDAVLWLMFLYWAIAGGFIGSVSAWWEKQPKKLLWGILSGFMGGGIGAYIGASLHAFLIQDVTPETWLMRRMSETLLGAIMGLTLWFAIAAAERFVIFKRHFIDKQDFKFCHHCKTRNELNSWYCTACGSVLQESAPSGKLNLSPYRTLQQISEMLRFLSRLSAATGFIAAFACLFVFIPYYVGMEQLMVVIAIVVIALISYSLQLLFSSLSEGLQIIIKK